jgi:hypothetical protein
MKKAHIWSALLGAGLVCSAAMAHHGTNTEYDSQHPVVFKDANVTEVEFANPHIQIYFDITDSRGKVVHWATEGPSPGRLIRMGWSRDEVKAGDHITITVEPARSGTSVGAIRKIVLPNGKELGVEPLVPQQ